MLYFKIDLHINTKLLLFNLSCFKHFQSTGQQCSFPNNRTYIIMLAIVEKKIIMIISLLVLFT